MTDVFKVAVLNTNQPEFDYLGTADESMTQYIGYRVMVPFRNTQRLGIICDYAPTTTELKKLKPIEQILDEKPLINASTFELLRWVSRYYQAPLSEVLANALPKKLRQGIPASLPQVDYYQLANALEPLLHKLSKQAKKQKQCLMDLSLGPLNRGQLLALGYSPAQLKTLVDKQCLTVDARTELPTLENQETEAPLTLNQEQAHVFNTIKEHLNHFKPFLLHGVTGSGKTEVYLQLITNVLSQGKQILVLVPEIGLTPQLVSRFKKRFTDPLCVLHSNLNDTERLHGYLLARLGHAKIIIGTRSAVFTPLPKLGLIIIDEEHDLSFKQMKGVRYSARETAIVRAQHQNIPIVLGSATPSLESLHNGNLNKYGYLRLSQQAIKPMPIRYQLIDCRTQYLVHGLTTTAKQAIERHLSQDNQVLVFINRRGYAPVLLCHECGWISECKHCDSRLTVHFRQELLQCHHCGYAERLPTRCPNCQAIDLVPVGAGTQRIDEYLADAFPQYTTLRIDRDSTRQKNAFNDKLNLINSGQAQLLIGTQMMAKGHHFPRLSLVVILDADAGFFSQDFKATERIGQLILQVAGRAGREDIPGEVLIQTHVPDNRLLLSLIQQGFDAFSQELLKQRQLAELPPFSHLALIRAKAKNYNRVLNFLTQVKALLERNDLNLMGPAPAPLEKKASLYRLQLLVKSKSRQDLNTALTQLRHHLHRNKLTNGIQWSIDVDPQDFM